MTSDLIIFLIYATYILSALTLCGLIADYVVPFIERLWRRRKQKSKGERTSCPKH